MRAEREMIPLHFQGCARQAPVSTVGIGLCCVAGFAWSQAHGLPGTDGGLMPATLWAHAGEGRGLWRLLSAQVLHGSLWHLTTNLVWLWAVGQVVETELGRWRTLVVFFVTGALALVVHAALIPESTGTMVGASAGIVGLLATAVMRDWTRPVRVLIPAGPLSRILWVPVWVLAGWCVLSALVLGWTTGDAGSVGTAWPAHLAGMGFGLGAGWLSRASNSVAQDTRLATCRL